MTKYQNSILSFLKRIVRKVRGKLVFAVPSATHFSPNNLKEKYRFHPDQLAPEKRKPGISGILRVLNEEEFLARAIKSHLPFLDEIVIALNLRCTDRSYEICYD